MPEMPEVNIVIKALKEVVLNKQILKVQIKENKMLRNSNPDEFNEFLNNESILNIDQLGKYIIFELSNHKYLISHLAMTGKYFFYKNKYFPKIHDHIIFYLNDNDFLVFNDYRKFGFFYLKTKDTLKNTNPLNKLGFMPNEALKNIDFLFNKIQKIKKPIKTLILDQTFLLGWGNIYADETLYKCKISPFRPANSLTKQELINIISIGNEIMLDSISKGGSSVKTYTSLNNQKGSYQNYLKVYGKDGQKCFECNSIIIKTNLNGRGTNYCPNCQKEN
ncbi:MAG: DNA-formamidopyrimidine glycosylase [Metamycoplasmataceae bacterium]